MAGVAACGWASGAAAQDSAARVLRPFSECRSLTEDAARLACFDRAAAALETAVKEKEVTIVDRADVQRARRSLFGFTLPRIDLFGGDANRAERREQEAFTEINSTVASARTVQNNRVEIRLAEDGDAVWRTTDPMPFPPRAGDAIRIRQGALGNYFIRVGGKSVRGMRVR